MKKLFSTIFIAALGAAIAIGAYALFFDKQNNKEQLAVQNMPVFRTNEIQANKQVIAPDFVQASQMTINSVVHIKTEMERSSGSSNIFDLYDFFYDRRSMPQEKQIMQASGSGVIISEDGYIVTNNHVVENALKVEVTLNDKRSYEATVVGTDPSTDLALLKVEGEGLNNIIFGNSDDLLIGEWVLAVGNPFNLTSTVTAGIVSAKGRNLNLLGSQTAIESFIQTDAAVNRGNSGGALVNTKGELIGINSAIASSTGSYAGYSFAIPVSIVKKVVEDLKNHGMVQRAFIGVSITEFNSKLAEEKGLDLVKGVYVADVIDGGSAAEAGIKTGDVIVSIDNDDVESTAKLLEMIGQHRPGEKVSIGVLRKDAIKNFDVILKNRNGDTQIVKSDSKMINMLGAEMKPIGDELKRKLKIDGGVLISSLGDGKLKDVGVKKGFIIRKIDKQAVNSVADVQRVLKGKKGGVLIEGIYPNGSNAYYGFGM